MGFLDIFRKRNKQNSFESLPDLKNYRIFLFLKGGAVDELRAHMDEYHKIYSTETAFFMDLFKLGDTSWTYIALTLMPEVAEISPMWDYLNILLWMSEKAEVSFAYAYSREQGKLPVVAVLDEENQYGDSCKGIANGKHFRAAIPEQEVTWGQSAPKQFDYEEYLLGKYYVDVRQA